MLNFDEIILRAQYWATDRYFDPQTQKEIQSLLDDNNSKELTERFYQDLEFGTGGLRGIIGAGTNRMNPYVVRRATQGLANYINQQFPSMEEPRVAISYDNRHFSPEFAREAAGVLAANGIRAFLFPELAPTPLLSFAVQELRAQAGIMVTASHNPPQYNGYKVYWDDGGQVVAPHDDGIIDQVNAINDFSNIKHIAWEDALQAQKVEFISDNLVETYYDNLNKLRFRDDFDPNIKIVYTPLHGAGYRYVIRALTERGFNHIIPVKEQCVYDPEFSTVKSPNPENPEAFEYAEKLAHLHEADLILATDPDSDRMAVVARHLDRYYYFNGNQTSALLAYYLFESLEASHKLPPNPVLIKTIVTSDLQNRIADRYKAECVEVLTGFKYIAEQMRLFETELDNRKQFVFGSEESYGYLAGTFVRDKDAVLACALISEMCAYYKKLGKTLYDVMVQLYLTFGYHTESLINVNMKGVEGQEKIKLIMDALRQHSPRHIGSSKVVEIRDYLLQSGKNLVTGDQFSLPQPQSNVLTFVLEDGSKISARPSGTEPKIKFYFGTMLPPISTIDELIIQGKNKIKLLEDEFMKHINSI